MKTIALLSVLLLAACPKASTQAGSMTPTTAPAAEPFAGTMAEAPKHALPWTQDVKPGCNQDKYAIVDVAKDQPFTINAKVSEGCAMISVIKDNGGVAVNGVEICADKPLAEPIAATGQDVRTLVTINETGACKGITISLEVK